MLSLLNIPFKLLINILTITNSIINLILIIIAFYIYTNKDRIVKYLKKMLSDLLRNSIKLPEYPDYNNNQDQPPFNFNSYF
jgi:predicted PurR-regulated permease PerM